MLISTNEGAETENERSESYSMSVSKPGITSCHHQQENNEITGQQKTKQKVSSKCQFQTNLLPPPRYPILVNTNAREMRGRVYKDLREK